MTDDDPELSAGHAEGRRLDRWLWFARVVKSRTLAASLVEAGKVRINREKVTKPSHNLKPGDVLTVALGTRVRILKVIAAGERRGPATEARGLFEDLTPPPPPRSEPPGHENAVRDLGSGRPTKRDRRALDRLKAGRGD